MTVNDWNPKDNKIGVIKEIDLARKMDVNQARLRIFRKEQLDKSDWFHEGIGPKRRVWWCDSGLEKLNRQYGTTFTAAVPLGETMEVVRANFPNKRVIQCRRANNELVIVRVRDSKNYVPRKFAGQPMTVRARKDGSGWAVEGRGPMRKGVL